MRWLGRQTHGLMRIITLERQEQAQEDAIAMLRKQREQVTQQLQATPEGKDALRRLSTIRMVHARGNVLRRRTEKQHG